ncbi:MobF family relaxase [Knoellia aerolata]|nr:MobF family relaxase [Knoellia aerolata]
MGVHKLTAGTGYTYLTRQVATHDRAGGPRTSLASYYTERGETPGRWVGAGVAGIDGLAVGDEVTAEQMQALFGAGLHPLAQQRSERLEGPDLTEADHRAVTRLGAPFKVYGGEVPAFQVEVARRIEDHAAALGHPRDYPVPAQDRARIRTEVATELFREQHGRDPADARELSGAIATLSRPRTTAVAGYDLTFSPVKSVSTLWAIAPPAVAAQVELAHHDAVADALRFLEKHALFALEGANGVRQVDVTGLVAAAFTHRDSRAGDPDLHTHIAVANKVQTRTGKWLSIDGRILFKANVTASETYNTSLEAHLRTRLGLRFEPGDSGTTADRDKRPVREVVGVDPRLTNRWSTRRTSIETRRSELAATFQTDHGRPPTAVEAIQLAQQATLETRDAKHDPRTVAEQRQVWRKQAEEVLGGPSGVAAMLGNMLTPGRTTEHVSVDEAWVRATALQVRDEVQARRATWQVWHLRAEAERQVRTAALPAEHVEAVVDIVTDHALTVCSVRLTPTGDGVPEPSMLRRADGSSVYGVAGSALFTSREVLAAETSLVKTAGIRDRHRASLEALSVTLLELAANGTTLNAGQSVLVRDMATSGARLQLAIAPAGAGKTTAMRALAGAWTEDGGTVIGLAPSAAAASVLREHLDATTDTLAKLIWSLDHDDLPDWARAVGPRTLVVIDEAGMADTLTLDAAVRFVTARGGQVRLVGDTQQLAAIGAGGVLRDIATTHGALHLSELMRFTDPAEGAASLALRDGRPESLGFYLDHGRIHVGDLSTAARDAFTAWATDRANHRDTIMLAPTRELVAELNQRAQAHRRMESPGGGGHDAGARLADGTTAYVGDTVLTRTNNRRLRLSTHDWAKNGDRWTVRAVSPDGALTVEHRRTRRQLTLPPGYVAASVELGYATTTHAAQGISVDTMHGLATGSETRQQLYTMLTRGAEANHLYLQVAGDGDPHAVMRPDHLHPMTATEMLEGILARDGVSTSATSTQREHASAAARLGAATARYVDALHVAAEHHLGPEVVAAIDTGADQVVPGIGEDPSWPILRAHLVLLATTGGDPLVALRCAASSRELDTASDQAAVLDWRLDDIDPRRSGTGPLRWLPEIPLPLRADERWGPYLAARSDLVSAVTAEVREAAATTRVDAPAWSSASHLAPDPDLLADLAVWRAATGVPDSDQRPTGPQRFGRRNALWQQGLEHRLGATHNPALAAWVNRLHILAPASRGDVFTPQLAARLAAIARSGVDTRALLDTALAAPLPDDHAGSALWWRISRHLVPAVANRVDEDALAPTPLWAARLPHTLGEQRAAAVQSSPWWPALIAVTDHALARGADLDDLLSIAEDAHDAADIDPCGALVWRISLLTDPTPPDPDTGAPPPEGQEDELEWIPPTMPVGDVPHARHHNAGISAAGPNALDDLHATLTAAALTRTSMGVLEPSPVDVEAMVAHAAEWDDAPFSPDRATHLHELARDYYARLLDAGWAGPYLRDRLRADHAPTGSGYAPPGWTHLVTHLRAHDVPDAEMLAAGLATRARTGTLVDRFRDRLVLPITVDGEVVGFVGRRHPHAGDEHGPRYLNTPTTVLFRKGEVLYGADHPHLDTGAIPVLVEGALDALAVTTACAGRFVGVAPLGTSLTQSQARLLSTRHPSPIVAMDADPAGRVAAERAYWLLAQHAASPRHAALPAATDPAALLHHHGPTHLGRILEAASPLAEELMDRRLRGPRRSTVLMEVAAVIAADTPDVWMARARAVTSRLGADSAAVLATLRDVATAWNRDPACEAQAQLLRMSRSLTAPPSSRTGPADPEAQDASRHETAFAWTWTAHHRGGIGSSPVDAERRTAGSVQAYGTGR